MLLPEREGCSVGGGRVLEALTQVLIEGCSIVIVNFVEALQLLGVEDIHIDPDLRHVLG